MTDNSFKSFNQQLSWSTKLYVLLAVSTVLLSVYLDAWEGYWFPTVLGAIAIVSLADFIGIYQSRYPGVLKKIGWILLLLSINKLIFLI